MSCPLGRGALVSVPQLAGDEYRARQPAVSGPKIDDMVALMVSGHWDWTDREINSDESNKVIIDGHHRYIAARIANVEPVLVEDDTSYTRTFAWGQLFVDSVKWPGGY